MISHSSSHSERRPSWQWWLLTSVALATLGFGFFGMWKYESALSHGEDPDFLSVFYHTGQLFILHSPHLEPPIPWELQVGRLLGAFLLLGTVVIGFLKFFRNEVRFLRLWLPWTRGHVLICGLGDLGLRLAREGHLRGKSIVIIEKHPDPAAVEFARENRILLLEGDARDPSQLRKARVERAEFIVASCMDDETNIAIASAAEQFALAAERRGSPLICRLLVQDPKLRKLFQDDSIFPHTGPHYRINLSDLDRFETAARQALRHYPLDFKPIHQDDDKVVHLVIISFGQMGQNLALHAARIGHFANEVGKGKRLKITIGDKGPGAGWAELKTRLHLVCDAEVLEFDAKRPDPAFVSELAALHQDKELVTFALCYDNEARNFRLGLELSRSMAGAPCQVLIYQKTRLGFASLFTRGVSGSGRGGRVHAFGMIEDIFTWDVLLHESEDALARAFHENYREMREREGAPSKDNPGWDDLSEELKDSNRQAADHVPIKLRALGLHEKHLRNDPVNIARFEENDVLLLAKMEHARWCAERFLNGWTYGPHTDRSRKINRCLVDWDNLPPEEQKKDFGQVQTIPEAIHRLGKGIYR